MNAEDTRCPECGEPVSATATYCLHCYADLPAGDADRGDTPEEVRATASHGATAGTDATRTDSTDAGSGWLSPASLLDDSMTVAVGLVGGLLAAVVVSVALVWVLPDVLPLLVGAAAGVGTAVHVARTRTVFGATRKAGYLLAALLAASPALFAFTAEMQENALGERLGLLVVLGVFVWPVALVLAAGGWLAGRRTREA